MKGQRAFMVIAVAAVVAMMVWWLRFSDLAESPPESFPRDPDTFRAPDPAPHDATPHRPPPTVDDHDDDAEQVVATD